MRLWTVHPRYLDAAGLVAAWREALLAQRVLLGRTRGYRNHPQLERFRRHPAPDAMIAAFLRALHADACERGYRFDGARIGEAPPCSPVEETEGQLLFEWGHLLAKLERRSPALHRRWRGLERPDPHPLFVVVPGPTQPWERT